LTMEITLVTTHPLDFLQSEFNHRDSATAWASTCGRKGNIIFAGAFWKLPPILLTLKFASRSRWRRWWRPLESSSWNPSFWPRSCWTNTRGGNLRR